MTMVTVRVEVMVMVWVEAEEEITVADTVSAVIAYAQNVVKRYRISRA